MRLTTSEGMAMLVFFFTDLPQVLDLVSACANDGPHEWLGDEDLDFQHGRRIPSLDVLNCHGEGGKRTELKTGDMV